MNQQVQMGHMQVAASGSRVTWHHLHPGALHNIGTVRNSFNTVITQAVHFTLLILSPDVRDKSKANGKQSDTDTIS